MANCKVCQKLFKTYPSKISGGKGKYCSKECAHTITNKILESNGIKTRIQPVIGLDNFRGGNWANGYKYERGKIRQHRKIAEEILGRKLGRKEVVHHIDENKQNNNLDNLVHFRKTNAHTRLHLFIKRHNLDGKLFSCLSLRKVGDAVCHQ